MIIYGYGMNIPSEFYAFLSYSSTNHATVELIANALRRRGLVFLDRWELIPGRSWPDALETHLGRCRSAVVILDPSGMGAWQHREYHLAIDRQVQESNFGVIPVLLPGVDPAGGFE